ncbi:hypothetical protein D9M68_253230 [compost metagenome]
MGDSSEAVGSDGGLKASDAVADPTRLLNAAAIICLMPATSGSSRSSCKEIDLPVAKSSPNSGTYSQTTMRRTSACRSRQGNIIVPYRRRPVTFFLASARSSLRLLASLKKAQRQLPAMKRRSPGGDKWLKLDAFRPFYPFAIG